MCYPQIDRTVVGDFLTSIKRDLLLPDRDAAYKVVDTAFEKGGIFAGYDSAQKIQCMTGFFFGDPAEDFKNKETAFVYVAAISSEFRLTRTFYVGMHFVFKQFEEIGLTRLRLQAAVDDRYNNRLYSRFVKPVGVGRTLRGHRVMNYEGSVADALAYFRPKSRPSNLDHPPSAYALNQTEHALGLTPIAG